MKREVVWAPEALRDVNEQLAFIGANDEHAANLVQGRIERTVNLLAQTPVGRPGRVPGTFEKRVLRTRYIIAYRLRNDSLQIARVIHSARDWPSGKWPKG